MSTLHGMLVTASLLTFVGCSQGDTRKTVVLYTALDQIFSESIIDQFERETGIDVLPVFDTESTKTVGLVNRIIAEEKNPQCDVFWNNEIIRTVMLKRLDLLQPYRSPAATDIPPEMLDDEGILDGICSQGPHSLVQHGTPF